MKRGAAALLAVVLLLCSCAEKAPDLAPFSSLVSAHNANTRIGGDYMLEITFGSGSTLFYANGGIAFDKAEEKAFADLSQTYLGDSSVLLNYFSNGKTVSVDDGEALEDDASASELFASFPYCDIPLPDENLVGSVTLGSNSTGKTLSFTRSDGKEMCDKIIGGDIYLLAAVIKEPQPEKTEYGNVTCLYTFSDERLVSVRYEFSVRIYDKEKYIPGYSVPESEYSIELHAVTKLLFTGFGDEVQVEEYIKK